MIPKGSVFIDETWASTTVARSSGRAPESERLRAIPHGHGKTTTFVGALRLTGMAAPMALDGPINGAAFLAYVDQVLVPLGGFAQEGLELGEGVFDWVEIGTVGREVEQLRAGGLDFAVLQLSALCWRMSGGCRNSNKMSPALSSEPSNSSGTRSARSWPS